MITYVFIGPIKIYRSVTGYLKRAGVIKDTCVFYPTCSAYAITSIERYGIFKGSWRAVRRICRCHPWQKDHYDPA